jgi:peptidoglycan/LPS O-acetylase OafA/YrhL
MVLFHHLFVFDPVGFLGRHLAVIVEFSSHGVDLFFALSGFLITRQLAASRTTPGFAARFWLHRFAKIVPLYLLITFGVFLLLKPLLLLTGHGEKLSWLSAGKEQWPWYLLFSSNIRNALDARFTNPALDVSWSLAVEVQFYVLAFVAARLVAPARWPRIAVMAIVAALAFRTAAVFSGAGWIPILVLTPGRIDAFACGGLAAMAPAMLARCPTFVLWILAALPIVTPWSRASPAVETAGYTLVAILAGVTIERVCRGRSTSRSIRILETPILVMFGRISYSVYLTHLPVRAALRDCLLSRVRPLDTPGAWLAQLGFWAGAGSVCILCGWLTWRFFEEPARRAVVGLLRPKAVAVACALPGSQ